VNFLKQLVNAVAMLADQNLTKGSSRFLFSDLIERRNDGLENFLKVNLWQDFSPVSDYEQVPSFENRVGPLLITNV
jgi:hypothetical protein